ncbi:MAG: hypothetical protein IT371_24555 [Deltaproteobacteria bacterium]|nr:hypothetical protein [Deltaproteobacteria bacterium]
MTLRFARATSRDGRTPTRRSRLARGVVLAALVTLTVAACRSAAPPPQPRADAGAPRAARADGVLQVLFSQGGALPACQLHLLVGDRGARQLSVELGDGRRRAFFPRAPGYWVRPARFPFVGPASGLQLELHTTLPWAPLVAPWPPRDLERRAASLHRDSLPRAWAFACVLRRPRAGGQVVFGTFHQGRPRLERHETLDAAAMDPPALRRRLERLLDPSW